MSDSTIKVNINKGEEVIGMHRTSTLFVEVRGDKKLVDGVENAVKKAVAAEIEDKKK